MPQATTREAREAGFCNRIRPWYTGRDRGIMGKRSDIEIAGIRVATEDERITMSPSLAANLHRYQLYANIRAGGTRMIFPPIGTLDPVDGTGLEDGSYLTRLEGERNYRDMADNEVDPFWIRATSSANHPLVSEIIDVYVSTLFRQPVDRSRVKAILGDRIYEDIDRKGTPVDSWLASIHGIGLTDGVVGVAIDYPPEDSVPPSLLHEMASGVRPYATMLPATSIWQLDRAPGGWIRSIIIQTGDKRFRIWTPEKFADVTEDLKIISQGTNPYGFVPVVLYIAEDPQDNSETAPLGLSAIRDSALIQLQYNQHASLLESLECKTNFPFLHNQDDPPQGDAAQDIPLGPGFMIYGPEQISWVSPDVSAAEESRRYLETLEARIYKIQGVHRRSQESVEAHSGLALDYEASPIYATVQRWSQRLRIFEETAWRMFAAVMGRSVDTDRDLVSYPEDFSTRPIDREVSQAQEIANVYGGYGLAPRSIQIYIDEKIRRGMKRDMAYLPVADEISSIMDQEQENPKEPDAPDAPDAPMENQENPEEGSPADGD